MRRGLPRVIPAFAAPLCNPNYKLNSFCARPPLRRDAFPGEPEGGPDGEAALRPLPGARSQPPRPLRWDGGGPAPRDGRRGVLRAAASPLPTAACALPARPRGAVERGPPAPGSGTGRRRRAPSPPRPSAQPRLGRSLTSPGAVPLAGGVRVGFTAPAPSRTNPQLFCGNELYASRAKKKRGGGSKRGVGKWAIKTDRATNEKGKKKKKRGTEGLAPASSAQPAAGCGEAEPGPGPGVPGAAVPGAPEPRRQAAAGGGEEKSALPPPATSARRFVLSVGFYWCSPFAKTCSIAETWCRDNRAPQTA